MNTLTFLPTITKTSFRCNCCEMPTPHLSMDKVIHDFWTITKDGKSLPIDNQQDDWNKIPKMIVFEEMANNDPDHDWRAICYMALHGETYQRQNGKWLLVEENEGYAL